MNPTKAFFSCSFADEDKEIVDYFKLIARTCGILPVLADRPTPIPIAKKVRTILEEVECFVAIITPSSISDKVASSWVNQEVGMAYERNLPLIALVEKPITDLGMIKIITEYIRFDRNHLHEVLDKALTFFTTLKAELTGRGVQDFYDNSTDIRTKIERYADIYDSRLFVNLPAKHKIARYVLDNFIFPDTKGIMLDSGTVTYTIADALIDSGLQIPIVTNNLAVVSKLKQVLRYPVTILPGNHDPRTQGIGGPLTAKAATEYLMGKMDISIDCAFLAANAIDPNLGFSADASIFSDFRAAILRHASKVVLVLQGEKLLKPISNPVVSRKEWGELLLKRASESSIWVICHKPVHFYCSVLESQYSDSIKRFRDKLPPNHVVEIG